MLLENEDAFADGLVALFKSIAGGVEVIWKDDAQPAFLGTDIARVLLNVVNDQGWGIDERRLTFDEDGVVTVDTDPATLLDGAIIAENAGLRMMTLSVEVEAWDQRPVYRARQLLEAIRLRLRRESSLSQLRAVDASLVDIGPTVIVPWLSDGRMYSKAVCEIRMHRAISEYEPPANYIETVEVTPTYDTGAGLVVDDPFEIPEPELD